MGVKASGCVGASPQNEWHLRVSVDTERAASTHECGLLAHLIRNKPETINEIANMQRHA
jgi:hypothetical protein